MTDILLLAFVFLVAGVFAVPLAARFGLGSVLGYLVAGILISPVLAALDVDVIAIQHFAEFGVVIMLFLVGLELEPRRLWEMRARLFGLGGLQVTATAGLVALAGLAFGLDWRMALATGLVLSLSSTAIVLQTLNEKGLMQSDGGRAGFSVLLFQDIAVIPMLALLPLLAMPGLAGEAASHGAEAHGAEMSLVAGLAGWQTALATLLAIAVVIGGGATLVGPLFRFITATRIREIFTAAALMLIVGIALLMSLVGLSPALGTFLAGVVLANSEYRHELEADIDPFRGLLLGLFFMTVGAGIRFDLLQAEFLTIAALTVGLMAVKFAVLWGLAVLFRIGGAARWLFALSLAQAGEFGFVLLSFTMASGVLPEALEARLLLVVALSMLLTPLLFILHDRRIAPRFAAAAAPPEEEIPEGGTVLVAGHGRVGGIVNRMLRGAGFETTVVDYSSGQLEMLRRFGFRVHFGDATRPDLLVAAGIERAKVLVVAIDGKAQITALVRHAIRTYPHLHVVARAVDREHVYALWGAGCRDIIRETYDSSLRTGRSALEALGLSRGAAERVAAEFDAMDREAMLAVADAYDPDIPSPENAAYVARVREVMEGWEEQLRGRVAAMHAEERALSPRAEGAPPRS